jgi:hypothetical protein
MSIGSRVDQERITVVVQGNGQTYNLGVFQTFAGGAVSAEDTKNRPGGMGDEESLGGPKSRDSFTVSRVFDLERDLPMFKILDNLCGSGVVSVGRQKLTKGRVAYGNPINYTGTLMKVTPPDSDSNASDRAEFTLEVSADEAIN